MKKFVYVSANGEPAHVIEPAMDDMLTDGDVVGEHLVVEVPFDIDTVEILTTKIYDKVNKVWLTRGPKPSQWHKWDGEWVVDLEGLHAHIRKLRNGRLSKTDWTQLPDNGLSEELKLQWQAYRQQLRDLPASLTNITSLDDVVWPTPPGTTNE